MGKFLVEISCPDGDFTAKEVLEIINLGFDYKRSRKGVAYRLSPIRVTKIKPSRAL